MIFSSAALVKPLAITVKFLVSNVPLPKIRIPSRTFFKMPASIRATGSTVAPSSKRFNCATLTSAYCLAKTLLKPRFGNDDKEAFGRLQNRSERHRQNGSFDLFDHDQMFYPSQNLNHGLHEYEFFRTSCWL